MDQTDINLLHPDATCSQDILTDTGHLMHDDEFDELGDDENIEWWEYDQSDEYEEAVAGDIIFLIESALDQRGDAVLALPGNEEALSILDRLADARVKWKNVTIIPTDDLLVQVSDERSHARALAERFLPLGARVVPLTSGDLDTEDAGRAADARLADIHWPLDLVWLGIGDDGETASIFPGADMEAALTAPHRAIGISPSPRPTATPDIDRVSLTGHTILNARSVLFGFRGDDKKVQMEQAIADGSGSALPAGRLVASATQAIDIHWCP